MPQHLNADTCVGAVCSAAWRRIPLSSQTAISARDAGATWRRDHRAVTPRWRACLICRQRLWRWMRRFAPERMRHQRAGFWWWWRWALQPSRHWQQPCSWPVRGSECSDTDVSVGRRVRVSPRGSECHHAGRMAQRLLIRCICPQSEPRELPCADAIAP